VRVTQELLYSPIELKQFFDKEKPDLIVHLASYGNMNYQKDPEQIVLSNLIGSFNMMKASLDVNYQAFVQVGSSSEYGKKAKAMNERDLLLPETFYGASKAGATHLAYAFAKQYDKPIVTVRPFSVYGAGEADFRFIPLVIKHMLEAKTFQCHFEANHDWIYIDDFIEGLLLAAEKVRAIPTRVINIGTGRMHSNKEICEMLKRISGIQYLANPFPGERPNDSEVWMSDNSLISSLGFYPKHMLKEGLEKTFNWYKQKYA